MSERYSRLFTAKKNLYAPGFPIIIEAGALLKDNDTNSILAQLKLLNITEKTITAVRLWITGTDSFGNQVEKRDFQLLDLTAKRNERFGQKIPLILENNTVRSFTTQLSEIVFSDGTSEVMPEVELISLGETETLSEHLKNNDLVQQYCIANNGDDCFFVPMETSDLWLCTCGTFNHNKDASCYTCKRERKKVFHSFNIKTLTTELTLRHHNELYNQAMNFFDEGNLNGITHAQKIFHQLGDFKNSPEMLVKCSDKINTLEQEQKLAEEAEKTRAAKEKKQGASLK